MFRAFRIFDPARALELNLTNVDSDAVASTFPMLRHHGLVDGMKLALPDYLSLAAGFNPERSDMPKYTHTWR